MLTDRWLKSQYRNQWEKWYVALFIQLIYQDKGMQCILGEIKLLVSWGKGMKAIIFQELTNHAMYEICQL